MVWNSSVSAALKFPLIFRSFGPLIIWIIPSTRGFHLLPSRSNCCLWPITSVGLDSSCAQRWKCWNRAEEWRERSATVTRVVFLLFLVSLTQEESSPIPPPPPLLLPPPLSPLLFILLLFWSNCLFFFFFLGFFVTVSTSWRFRPLPPSPRPCPSSSEIFHQIGRNWMQQKSIIKKRERKKNVINPIQESLKESSKTHSKSIETTKYQILSPF